MTLTALPAPPQPCEECQRKGRNRWGAPLPRTYPDNMMLQHLLDTFEFHPWLETDRLGDLIRHLRDAAVSSA